jgi:hypothetical protein
MEELLSYVALIERCEHLHQLNAFHKSGSFEEILTFLVKGTRLVENPPKFYKHKGTRPTFETYTVVDF